ncbi:LLM class flavin-dependent oxidoreductase [Xylanibacillus composti]|uniref:Luciferase-like domain-containing protein n=1 Tax=Xylanibacillus composti TaxID=1572762 RepID=A0A8J4H307_9BACL|nr:LLM class flavin-dependent oxidoreductase [Xylanibacillus composti]MDT9725680.1 LLM class flavin-dependent oxidoreductase [Xylanibacillus composti]GIQ67778.1 hypothetical protein XYCOK13_06020 [Xylanibacillus composti]
MRLGVLDQSQIAEGRTAIDALNETTKLAQVTEQLGFSRFWVSEHHASESLAHSSPEVLLAHLGAHTTSIRLGSGGVMLPHYSAYKVAENFKLLEALQPGRIDLGLGRAPGGMPIATRALQENKYVNIEQYPQQVLDILHYLHNTLPEEHRFAGLHTSPSIPSAPDVWLLGSSDESAKLAARLGLPFAFAQFFGVTGGQSAMRYYREHYQPSALYPKPQAMAAVLAICADTEEEANRLAWSTDLFFLRLEKGLELSYFPSVQTAEDYPYTEYDLMRIQQTRQRRIIGTPEQVKEALLAIQEAFQTDELLIVSPIHDFQARLHSYKRIAEACQLTQTKESPKQ